MNVTLLKQSVAEFIGTFALIFIGVGVIANHSNLESNSGLLAVALAHGLTIAVMVSATGAISGGHLNPAVTFGVWVGGDWWSMDQSLRLLDWTSPGWRFGGNYLRTIPYSTAG